MYPRSGTSLLSRLRSHTTAVVRTARTRTRTHTSMAHRPVCVDMSHACRCACDMQVCGRIHASMHILRKYARTHARARTQGRARTHARTEWAVPTECVGIRRRMTMLKWQELLNNGQKVRLLLPLMVVAGSGAEPLWSFSATFFLLGLTQAHASRGPVSRNNPRPIPIVT